MMDIRKEIPAAPCCNLKIDGRRGSEETGSSANNVSWNIPDGLSLFQP
jgi:hypothetical protein